MIHLKQKEKSIATKFGILSQCEALEYALLKIPNVINIEFDLSGFYDDMEQLIFLVKYSIPVTSKDYFAKKQSIVTNVLSVISEHDLVRTDDKIEDYGEHLYFVTHCGNKWNITKER